MGVRSVQLVKLRPPEDREDGPLTDREILALTKRGLFRAYHYLWLAEQYMCDMSRLGQDREFDDQAENVAEASRYLEGMVSRMMGGGPRAR